MIRIDYADVNGVALRYALRESGRPRLVLIHEMGGTMENWDEAAAILADHFDILTYDTRGAGLSEKIAGDVSIDDLAADAEALLAHVGWTGPVLVAGTAIGAATGIRLALRAEGRVAGLACLSPALGVDPAKREGTLDAARRLVDLGVRAATDPRWDVVWPPDLRDVPARAAAVRCRKLGNDPESFAALYRMVAGMDVAADLPQLACPVLFVAGRRDGTRPPEYVRSLAAQIAGARYEEIETGHVMQAMAPEQTAGTLLRFFSSLA
ncbi:alpha/beta hydrolase [Primorskyibacter flagellatus]|uniref:Alpha/beta hydrolase n=1 Tax=Primorskyibacter flagellatus TaxID=1387277 RepID=A0A917EIT8_9RHOB|nr:alpha/beta hydrolase [Primorskyibacter flagellatus]GGE50121.1 alpha/beta hydrolase [Primorskyibacter flagellatus]